MNNEFSPLTKKHSETLIEQTETQLQETLEFTMKRQMENFYFSPPINSIEQGKWLLAVTSSEATNSLSIKTNENNSFSI